MDEHEGPIDGSRATCSIAGRLRARMARAPRLLVMGVIAPPLPGRARWLPRQDVDAIGMDGLGAHAYNRPLTSILVVDQDVDFADLLQDGLRRCGYDAKSLYSAPEALTYLDRHPVDIIVAHVHLREVSGLELVSRLRDRQSEVLGIVVTSHGSMETAVEAIRAGAYDFITKPVKVDALEIAVGRAIEHLSLRREVKRLRIDVAAARPIDGIAGDSPAIRETIEMVRRVADSDATVLITGESGTGKELVARALHDLSPRRDHPFVAVNCARDAGAAARERAVRPRSRRVHRREAQSRAGPVRAGRRRHDLPRRDRRDADRDAGQAAARPPGAQGRARSAATTRSRSRRA